MQLKLYHSSPKAQMYTDTTLLTIHLKCLLYTIFASDMDLNVYVYAGTNRFSSWATEANTRQSCTTITHSYLQLVHMPLNKWIRLNTQLINDARFRVLPFLLAINCNNISYITSLPDKREFKGQNMYENTPGFKSLLQTDLISDWDINGSDKPFSHFAQQT